MRTLDFKKQDFDVITQQTVEFFRKIRDMCQFGQTKLGCLKRIHQTCQASTRGIRKRWLNPQSRPGSLLSHKGPYENSERERDEVGSLGLDVLEINYYVSSNKSALEIVG